MNVINKLPKSYLLLIGWAMFIVAIFLPVNVSIGGLTDAGRPHIGLINLFYSFACIYIIPFEGLPWNNLRETANIFMEAGLGICNFLLLLSPAVLWLKGKKAVWAGRLMIVATLYVCTIGFVVYRNFPLLYGHYVWCLSFIVVAVALNLMKPKPENNLS
jgi:hypothetical protein